MQHQADLGGFIAKTLHSWLRAIQRAVEVSAKEDLKVLER